MDGKTFLLPTFVLDHTNEIKAVGIFIPASAVRNDEAMLSGKADSYETTGVSRSLSSEQLHLADIQPLIPGLVYQSQACLGSVRGRTA